MTRGQKVLLAVGIAVIVAAAISVVVVRKRGPRAPSFKPVPVEGAVMRRDTDPRKQTPLAGVSIIVTGGSSTVKTQSDASGFFKTELKPGILPGQAVTVRFTQPDYHPLETTVAPLNQLVVARMDPVLGRPAETPGQKEVVIKNDVRVRYSVKVHNTSNVGFAAKAFQVQNLGDVACNNQPPCSPDGKWKASTGSITLDAQEGNVFSNIRVSCIAGPCPFTRIDPPKTNPPSRYLKVTAESWSDTATFLVEAEVTHTRVADMIRYSYPVIFGPGMNFTLPAGAEGPSIEATLNGDDIVFPLGPALILSWATCTEEVSPEQTRIYRCELKPGYTFQGSSRAGNNGGG